MPTFYTIAAQLLVAATCVLAAKETNFIPTQPEAPPAGLAGELFWRFKPYLYSMDSCEPFPAVDGQGNTNKGQDARTTSITDCSSNSGQIYARAKPRDNSGDASKQDKDRLYDGLDAIMYVWYFPRNTNSASKTNTAHRHDWQQLVVWLQSKAPATSVEHYSIHHLSYSTVGGYAKTLSPALMSNSVVYNDTWPLVSYQGGKGLDATIHLGTQQNLLLWDTNFTPEARAAINNPKNFDWNQAPFSDAKFEEHLKQAF